MDLEIDGHIVSIDLDIKKESEIPKEESITPKCHPASGMNARIKIWEHVLELRCAECGAFCEAFVTEYRIKK